VAAAILLATACGGPDGSNRGTTSSPGPTAASPTPGGSTPSPDETTPAPGGRVAVSLRPVADGLEAPVAVAHAGDGSGRLYVVEQAGRVRVLEPDGSLRAEPYLDISERVGSGGERGLLGLAFHPEFPQDDRLFVNYTETDGDTVIASFRGDAESADPGSEEALIRVDQPFPNHNGGQVAFGPDGLLYLGLGDGGGGGDPFGNGQRTDTLLGKILRIDVDARTGGRPYVVPPDNPFAGGDGGRPEIWATGLRNPWRFSFDRETGDLFIGDVGQEEWEEIDVFASGTGAGANLGWNVMEGSHCYEAETCDRGGLVLPVAEYDHSQGCAVVGGHVYRGRRWPALAGSYLYGDACSGFVWTMEARAAVGGRGRPRRVLDTDLLISSFGEDEAGELYVTDLAGGIYRVEASAG
jgi:glucose/arabinose dehydrogenase